MNNPTRERNSEMNNKKVIDSINIPENSKKSLRNFRMELNSKLKTSILNKKEKLLHLDRVNAFKYFYKRPPFERDRIIEKMNRSVYSISSNGDVYKLANIVNESQIIYDDDLSLDSDKITDPDIYNIEYERFASPESETHILEFKPNSYYLNELAEIIKDNDTVMIIELYLNYKIYEETPDTKVHVKYIILKDKI